MTSLSRGEHSPIYVDNGRGQTVAGDEISARERVEIQEDLLQVLGLHRRPRPVALEVRGSASSFLMDIYNSMIDDEDTGEQQLQSGATLTLSCCADSILVLLGSVKMCYSFGPYRPSAVQWFQNRRTRTVVL